MKGISATSWIVTLAAIAVIAAAFLARGMFVETPGSDLDISRDKLSVAGLYRVSIAPENEPVQVGTLHSWIVTVKDANGQSVEGARLAVSGGMPAHGHGLPTSPQMTEALGAGRYRIEGVKFNMDGHWEFILAISASPGDDQVIFNLMF